MSAFVPTSSGLNAVVRWLLPFRRGLRVCVVGVGLVGFVMADHTARRSAELAVASHVAGNAADDGAFDAPLGLRRRNEGECEQASRGENHFHGHSPRSRVRRVKSLEEGWFRADRCASFLTLAKAGVEARDHVCDIRRAQIALAENSVGLLSRGRSGLDRQLQTMMRTGT